MSEHIIHKGDTGTPLTVILGDSDGNWDLTGATILFRYAVDGVVTEKSLTADIDQTTNPGKAAAFWAVDELDDVDIGAYPCQAKVTFSTGKIRYAPSRGHNVLQVRAPLGL